MAAFSLSALSAETGFGFGVEAPVGGRAYNRDVVAPARLATALALFLVVGGAALVAGRIGIDSQATDATPEIGFLRTAVGSGTFAAPTREPLPAQSVRIDRSGYTVRGDDGSVSIAARDDGRSPWSWYTSGVLRATPFGAEAITVTSTGAEQYLVIDRRGSRRVWRWSLAATGLLPRLRSDGSIAFVGPGGRVSSLALPAPRILDLSGADITPTGLQWRLARRGSSWLLSLSVEDARLPAPYVIDPAITFDAASSAGGASVSSLSWSHTVASQSNRMIVVGVESEYAASSSCQATAVTYGGAALTRIAQAVAGNNGKGFQCVSLWYRAAPAVGTATVSVTYPTTMDGATAGAVSLYNVKQGAPDASNSSSSNSGATSTSVTTTAPKSWVVDIFGSGQSLGNLAPAAGQTSRWTRDAGGTASNSGGSSTKTVAAAGSTTLTWTQTGINHSAQVVAAFSPACSGGSLSLSAPTSATFPSFTLNGTDQTATTTVDLTPDDETGSDSGWNITGTSTTLTNGSGRTLPVTATQETVASTAAASGNCSLPTNSVGYPLTLPAGPTPPTPVKLYNAAAGSGWGPVKATLTFRLSVPANSFRGIYTSTWTFAIVSGP
jgi:hypothetical protein